MRVAIVLISKDGFYLGENGELPKRPSFDKELITSLAKDKIVLCSENTKNTIPPSIKKVAKAITTDPNDDWEINFGIKTYNEDNDIFIIVNSEENLNSGKEFKLSRIKDKYTEFMSFGQVDIYHK
jgi:hypothetical protein